jgi:hypothetical protein
LHRVGPGHEVGRDASAAEGGHEDNATNDEPGGGMVAVLALAPPAHEIFAGGLRMVDRIGTAFRFTGGFLGFNFLQCFEDGAHALFLKNWG